MEQQEETTKDLQVENLRTGIQFEEQARIRMMEAKGEIF